MPSKRTEATPAKTGRTWSPIKGLTLTERGPLQIQARVRRTGRPAQTKTFESVAEAEAWGVRVLDGFNRNTFVDRRRGVWIGAGSESRSASQPPDFMRLTGVNL